MAHKYHQKIIPTNQDLDTEVRHMKDGAVRYALNGRMGSSKDSSQIAWDNIRSSLLVDFTMPNGRNKCIGTTTDRKNKRVYYYIWNSLGYNGIYAYQPQIKTDPIKLLFSDTPENRVLDFNEFYEIKGTKSKVVDGKWLMWTDKYNAPRCINLEWCYTDKKQWRIKKSDTYTIKVSGVIQTISHQQLANYFIVDDCKCFKLTQINDNIELVGGIALNFYPKPHNERQIDFVQCPPAHAPLSTLSKDADYKRNFLNGYTWQFRVQYKYKNGSYSVWSAWSKLLDTSGKCTDGYNCIDIDYSDDIFDLFSDNNQIHLIDKVIIGFRNTNRGNLYKFVTIDSCDIPEDEQVYRFYNDVHAEAVDDYTNLKQYDTVPLQAGTLNLAQDRVVMGDVVENYDAGCFDFDVDIKFHKKGSTQGIKTGSFRVPIVIHNDGYSGVKQPIYKDGNTIYYGGVSALGYKNAEQFGQMIPEGGFPVYLAGTDYLAISRQEEVTGHPFDDVDKKIWELGNVVETISYAEFKNIPIGTYIVRIASHWCSYGDVLGKGEYYNLDSGRKYQLTSTNLRKVNNNPALREYIVTVTDGMNIDIPIFEIEDCCAMISGVVAGEAVTLVQGYFIDSISPSQTDLKSGTRVEDANISYWKIPSAYQHPEDHCDKGGIQISRTTDHNGYSYAKVPNRQALGSGYKFLISKQYPNGSGNFLWNSEHFWEGNLGNLQAESLADQQNCAIRLYSLTWRDFIFPIRSDGKSNIQNNYRTRITGRVVDNNGAPIKNAKIIVSETSRIDTTDINGNFSILVYTNKDTGKRTGTLIVFDDECCYFSTSINFEIQLGQNDFNNTHDYNIGDITVDACENKTLNFYLKNGGVYDFGITLMDRALRKTTVVSREKEHRIRLPFTTENIQDYLPQLIADADGNAITSTTKADGYFTADIKLKTKPPIWATHLYALRTEDQVYADYLQFVVSDVKYVVKYDETTTNGIISQTPVTTTYQANDANEIYLDLGTSFIEYNKHNSESLKGWTFERGDRIRFLYKKDGTLRDFLEVEIKEQRGSEFVIPYIETTEILKGEVVEVFRLKTKREKQFFYETSEYAKVLSPYTDLREWENTLITLNTGDAYRRSRKMYAKDNISTDIIIRNIEDATPSEYTIEKDNDIGRPDFVNDNMRQLRRKSVIRFGGKYIPQSLINNVHSFNAEDEVATSEDYGAITILEEFEDTLFVAQWDKCHTRHINKQTAFLGDGQQILLDANRFLSDAYFISLDIGCRNPESHAKNITGCKFYDSYRGIVGQYNKQAGIANISGLDTRYGTSKNQEHYFKGISDICKDIDSDIYNLVCKCYGAVDTANNEYILTIKGIDIQYGDSLTKYNGTGNLSNIGDNDVQFSKYTTYKQDTKIDEISIAYSDKYNVWHGFRSYTPEMWGELNNDLIGFVDGKLWVMEQGEDYGVFFGTAYEEKFQIIANTNPSELKSFLAFSFETNEKWSNPSVMVYNTRAFREIKSFTPDGYIKQQQGAYYAPFLMDINTPNVQYPLINGRKLSGEALSMEISNNSRNKVTLFAVNIYAQYIPRTNF